MWSCKKDSIEKKNNYGQIQKINNNFILSFVDSLFAWLVVLTARNFLLKASEFVEQRWKQKRLRVISEQTSFRRLFYDDDEKISLTCSKMNTYSLYFLCFTNQVWYLNKQHFWTTLHHCWVRDNVTNLQAKNICCRFVKDIFGKFWILGQGGNKLVSNCTAQR